MRVLALVLLTLLGCVDFDAPTRPGDDATLVVEVPTGATARSLAPRLIDDGVLPGEWQWRLFLRTTDADCLKAGRFHVRRSMSMREVLETLCGPPLPRDEPFTVPEGWRARDVDAALAARGWLEPGAYLAVVEGRSVPAPFEVTSPTYEGYLFPETYMVVPEEFTAEALVSRQLATFKARFLDEHGDHLNGRTLHEVVVMASMLEREEPVPATRPLVAGVLWKRLDHGWNLGVDATSRYTLDAWNDRRAFLKQLRDPADVYNTRLRGGLPPTAIGNPGLVSLVAAVNPVDSEFWYYLHDAEGRFHGARDIAGHEANRRRYNVY